MNLDARTERTLLRLLSLFLAAGAGDAIVQFATSSSYDWRHLIGALAAAAVLAVEQFLKNSGDLAPPSIAAVDVTLQAAFDNPLVNVPPPKMRVPSPQHVVQDEPDVEPH